MPAKLGIGVLGKEGAVGLTGALGRDTFGGGGGGVGVLGSTMGAGGVGSWDRVCGEMDGEGCC